MLSSIAIVAASTLSTLAVYQYYEATPLEEFVGYIVAAALIFFTWSRIQTWRKNNYIRLNCTQKISEHQYEVLKKWQTKKAVDELVNSKEYANYMNTRLEAKAEEKEDPDDVIEFDDE